MSGKIKKSNLDADVTAMINTLITEGSSDVSTTDDVSEGSTNLYYTDGRADARIAAADTDDLSEGSTNLYYTDARADARADLRIGAASTSDLSEGTNLYFTDARADARITAADTDDLSEGSTNLYYTDARADARITAADTDDLSEGSTNLYYTDARVDTRLSGNRTYGNITTTGYIAGPATLTIDPAGVGDNTGTVVIAGSLQVDGTTTTINSSTMTVDDLNIVLASGAANAAAANGAGLTVDGASASITYDGTNDEWDFNKAINVSGNVIVSGTVDGRDVAADGTKLDGIASGATNVTNNNQLTNGAGYTTYSANQAVDTSSNVTFGSVTATPAATLIVYNSSGTAVKTINGITAA